MPKTRRKLTYKEDQFVKNFTNEKNPETFLNATKSALNSYNATYNSAGVIASDNLKKTYIQEAIAKRISTKDEDIESLTRLSDRIEEMLSKNTFSEENATFFKALSSELRENHKLKGQFRGDFVEQRINININTTINSLNDASKEIESDFDVL